MRYSLGVPFETVDPADEFWAPEAVASMTRAAEATGFDALSVTDHPFPNERWLSRGGHHAADPVVALSVLAGASTGIQLHTNVLILGYRNPFLAAKATATLDRLSGGRLILGVGAGYLEPEFAVLGADFEHRNARLDEGIEAMRAAWSGQAVDGHVMLPTPLQQPGPPIWVGGNSKRAIRRAVTLGDGWMPFPLPKGASRYTRTANLEDLDDLRTLIAYAHEQAAAAGRSEPLDICFVPFGMTPFEGGPDLDALASGIDELEEAGVTWLSVQLPAPDRATFLDNLHRFAERVIHQ